MAVRRAVYRIQLRPGFGFDDAAGIAAYLADLGISHLYCSPYLQAVAGSTHGYDVVDPERFSDDLGGAPGHARMVGALRQAGMGQVLDIVPNHMAADPTNRWWWDVLENGRASRYARFFDIEWTGPDGRSAFAVLVPVLGDQYGRVLEAGELVLERAGGDFRVRYYEHCLPLSPRTLDGLLGRAARRAGSEELAALADGFAALPPGMMADPVAVAERHDQKVRLSAELARLCAGEARLADAVDGELAALNHDLDRLDQILRRQNYRLAYWRTASEELDYRRFFNIETLVGVRVEDPKVFAATHMLVLDLVRDGTLDGLRVDHVDGLVDPQGYLQMLAQNTGGQYSVVEKILQPGEAVPDTWAVAGTTGYDFLNRVNGLYVASDNEDAMSTCYRDFTGQTESYDEVAYGAKQQIMGHDLRAELERLVGLLALICEHFRRHRDHTRSQIRDTLREVVAHFPVYRTYVHPRRVATQSDRAYVGLAVTGARARRPDLDPEFIDFIGQLALAEIGSEWEPEFCLRLQQFTAPVMAKGVEDTAFYRYNRLISLNEVGGNPGIFGRPVKDFHVETARTAAQWPETFLTLSTHDTKRSGDVRARINVLSELPGPWAAAVGRWASINQRHRRDQWPDADAEYLLYQTLAGAWPLDADRAAAFMAKATKEAKLHTSWMDPASDYDRTVEGFTRAILADRLFLEDFEGFMAEARVVERGRRNSLSQTAIALIAPGVPDIYQGTEIWDLSLVDPDNRRPVDYAVRRRLLAGLSGDASPDPAPGTPAGVVKMWLIHRVLQHRRHQPELYVSSRYEPLHFTGPRADDLVGFDRGGLAVVVPRLGDDRWDDTRVDLASGQWTDVLTGEPHDGGGRGVAVRDLLASFPVAVLTASPSR